MDSGKAIRSQGPVATIGRKLKPFMAPARLTARAESRLKGFKLSSLDRKSGTVPEQGLSPRGKVVSLNISPKKGQKKTSVDSFELVEDKGVAGDAHYGSERQVSFLPLESIQKMRQEGLNVNAGSFAENITVSGVDFEQVSVGSRLKLGQTIVEITDIGKDCHAPCAIYKQAGYCVMPEDGIFAKIIKGGKVKQGDSCEILR